MVYVIRKQEISIAVKQHYEIQSSCSRGKDSRNNSEIEH